MTEFFVLAYGSVLNLLTMEALWRVLVIVLVAYLIYRYNYLLIGRLSRSISARDLRVSEAAANKRRETLERVLGIAASILIIIVAAMMSLQQFGVNITPILAAAGVAGIAIGFGGQYLIRDLISGLFIILENQYRVGDVVRFGSTAGVVEDITLRMTTLRDLDGIVHHIPHGEITETANLTKYFSRVNLDVGIAYDTNLEHAMAVINRVGEELTNDPERKEHIKDAPKFLRVDDFADSAIVVKIVGDTLPGQQWAVTGELRKRLKIAFDNEGIVIPFPQRVLHTRSH